MKNDYFVEIPFVRAMACLMIVFVHVTAVAYSRIDGFSNDLNLLLNQFSRLGTPVFAVISAFLLFSSVKRKGFNLQKFLFSRTTKVVVPFVVWTLLYLFISWHREPISTDMRSVAGYFILGTGYYHLYFMVTVIQFYIFFPLIQLVRIGKCFIAFFLLSIPLNYFWLVNTEYHLQGALGVITSHRSFFLNWISYFSLGAVFAYYYEEIMRHIKKHRILLGILFGLVLIGIYMEISPERLFGSSRPANLIYIPILFLFLLSVFEWLTRGKFLTELFNTIGNYSMGIYLVHPLVILLLEGVLPNQMWHNYFILFIYAVTIVSSVAINRLILYLPKSNYIILCRSGRRGRG